MDSDRTVSTVAPTGTRGSKHLWKLMFGALLAVTFISSGAVAQQCPQGGLKSGPALQLSPSVLVKLSTWKIRHGIQDERYNFRANGSYDYIRSAGQLVRAAEDGQYTVQRDHLILRPAEGSARILCWRIGTHTTPYHNPINQLLLWLNYPDGREEFYYPTENR